MSTGRRLAKRSIIGTKVCAPGPDGLWYSGVIQDVKTPSTATVTNTNNCGDNNNEFNINDDTIYIVRFDFKTQSMLHLDSPKSVIMEARRAANMHISPAQALRRNAMIKEFRESELIGPGFRSIMGIQLQPGQRIFLTHNGRETSGDIISHDVNIDELVIKITGIGNEEPIELKKRLEEVRLLESRRSARLADQDRDTDFARLADMGGDRHRRTSHSIEVPFTLTPQQQNSRKRPPSYTHEFVGGDKYNEEDINACKAAMILMNLSNSPKSPKNGGEKWLASSPGSSSASWSSGSSSPPLSDDGNAILLGSNGMLLDAAAATARIRTTSVSTSDEGIVVDFKEEGSRKKRGNKLKFKCMWKGCNIIEATQSRIKGHIRHVHLGQSKKARRSIDHDGSFSESGEEDFYYEEEDDDEEEDEGKAPSPTSPPTLSHRDMARPPHEDPEYQRKIVGTFKQGRSINQYYNGKTQMHHLNGQQQQQQTVTNKQLQQNNITVSCIPTSPLAHHNYTWPSPNANEMIISPTSGHIQNSPHQQQQQQQQQQQHSPTSTIIKHARCSPRPSQSTAPYPSPTYGNHYNHHHHQHHNQNHHNSYNSSGNSSNGSSCNNSPIIHNNKINNSANNVFHQLSQQNVTITPHSNQLQQQQQQQQQQTQLSAITITPNFVSQTPSPQQPQQQQQQQRTTSAPTTTPTPTTTTANNNIVATNTNVSPQQHVAVQHAVAAAKHTPNSPNRRTRGENKKCRKVYGMERRDEWCTQCKWKKACTRFGD